LIAFFGPVTAAVPPTAAGNLRWATNRLFFFGEDFGADSAASTAKAQGGRRAA
jgi:hypothetical protein